MTQRKRQRRVTRRDTAMRATLACLLLFGPLVCQAAAGPDSLLAEAAQQLLDQDFAAARETIRRAAADGSDKTKELQASVDAVAGMPGCLVAPFRQRVGHEVRVNFPDGTEVVRIAGVGHQGDIKAERLLKAGGKTVGTTPRNFNLADLPPGERVKLLGRDESGERQIMRGILAWEANRPDAAKRFFAKSEDDLGRLLIARVDQVAKDRQAAAARERKGAQEAAATKAYETMLNTAGVERLRNEPDKMILAIRRKRFTEADVAQIRRQLGLLTDKLAKTAIARNNPQVLKCFALVRPVYPLEVDQTALDKVLAKLNKDNPKELIQAKFTVSDAELSLSLKEYHALVDLSALTGLPITNLEIENCNALADLSPLKGMPLRSLRVYRCKKVVDISPLQGMALHHLTVAGADRNSAPHLTDLTPLRGMPLEELHVSFAHVTDLRPLRGMKLRTLGIQGTKVTDLTPLKGMPLERLYLRHTRIPDLSPVKTIKGLEIRR